MKFKIKKSAFTLIELLVVITIMGILAVGGISTYNSQIQKARDTTRVNDVTALNSAIAQFYNDKSVYPKGQTDWVGTTGFTVVSIMPNLASDPKHNQQCNESQCGYVYGVENSKSGITDGAYEVSTAFENAGNLESKAAQRVDGGDDDARYELGYEVLYDDTARTGVNTKSPSGTLFSKNGANNDTKYITITKDENGKPVVYQK